MLADIFFPWLKNELENQGIQVFIPPMPNVIISHSADWVAAIKKAVDMPDVKTYFVGHSLGVIAILRYLESLTENEKIGGAVFVAGFAESIGYHKLENFFTTPLDYKKVKGQIIKKFVAIHSDNDTFVPKVESERLREKLGAELIVVSGAWHFDDSDGFKELPAALEVLRGMMN